MRGRQVVCFGYQRFVCRPAESQRSWELFRLLQITAQHRTGWHCNPACERRSAMPGPQYCTARNTPYSEYLGICACGSFATHQ